MGNDTLALPLKDILPAAPASAWPPAPIWWVSLSIIVILFFLIVFLKKYYQTYYWYRRQTLKALEAIIASDANDVEKLNQLTRLIKQTAITAYPNENVNTLHGEEWVDFLNKKTRKPLFSQSSQAILKSGQYQNTVKYNLSDLIDEFKNWINAHKKSTRSPSK